MKNNLVNYLSSYKILYDDKIYLKDIKNHKIIKDAHSSSFLDNYLDLISGSIPYNLIKSDKKIILEAGNPKADILFIRQDLEQDIPSLTIIDKSIKLLDKMLDSIGLSRKEVYILNVLQSKLQYGDDLSIFEFQNFKDYLVKKIDIIKPKLIVCLDKIYDLDVLNKSSSLENLRKERISYSGVDLLVTYPPEILLKDSKLKKYAWEDFKLIRDKYINGK